MTKIFDFRKCLKFQLIATRNGKFDHFLAARKDLIRTNFRAFAQKSEKCAKITTVITRELVCAKINTREN